MSGEGTKHMLAVYEQMSPVPGFFASLFTARADSIYNSETVEIDIERDGEEVAAVLSDTETGVVLNTFDQFTNKEFTPPKLGEGYVITAGELQKRMAGNHPFESVDYQANANMLALKKSSRVEAKIMCHINLQAAQVLQTGALSLYDEEGNVGFSLDFKPKATHFPTSSTGWGQVGATPLADIESLATVIRTDGKRSPNQLIMGSTAFTNFINDDDVKALLDNRRYELGQVIAPADIGGGEYHGRISIGPYVYDIWTCDERYKDIATGNSTAYMDADKVIVRAAGARMDATYGSVPFVVEPEGRALRYLPSRIVRLGAGGVAMWPNAFVTTNNKMIQGELYTRPLMIPVAIDTYGCLDTQP